MTDVSNPVQSIATPTPATAAPGIVQRNLVVVGASAGGVQALQSLVAQLPSELPASVLIVLHLSAGTSVLDSILDRAGPLPVTQAHDGEIPERGHVYVAPPDRHLLLRGAAIHLSAGPRENGHRPAIDPLFRSAARAYGRRAIGVILSGTLDDGTDGLRLIKQRGGATVVQDPDDAAYGDMPRSAVDFVGPDHVAPLAEIGRVILGLIETPLDPPLESGPADPTTQPLDLVEVELGREEPLGDATLLTCPACGGVMMERQEEGGLIRFACQVGHAYSPESLVERQGEPLEQALWGAVRTLEERADLLRRMARRADRRGAGSTGGRLEYKAAVASGHAAEIRGTLLRLRETESEWRKVEETPE